MRVLIGADDPGTEQVLIAAVECFGYPVVAVARSPHELRALCGRSPPDVVLAQHRVLAGTGVAGLPVPAIAVCPAGNWDRATGPSILAWVAEPLSAEVLRVVLLEAERHLRLSPAARN
jgi:hypothetical protein